MRRAVEGLGDLMDDYEFHYPQELSEENVDEVRDALDGHGIYTIAPAPTSNPRFGKGGLSSPDDDVRAEALAEGLRAADFAASVGAQLILLAGSRGLQLPVPDAYGDAWARFVDGVGEVGDAMCRSAASGCSSSTRTPSRR